MSKICVVHSWLYVHRRFQLYHQLNDVTTLQTVTMELLPSALSSYIVTISCCPLYLGWGDVQYRILHYGRSKACVGVMSLCIKICVLTANSSLSNISTSLYTEKGMEVYRTFEDLSESKHQARICVCLWSVEGSTLIANVAFYWEWSVCWLFRLWKERKIMAHYVRQMWHVLTSATKDCPPSFKSLYWRRAFITVHSVATV